MYVRTGAEDCVRVAVVPLNCFRSLTLVTPLAPKCLLVIYCSCYAETYRYPNLFYHTRRGALETDRTRYSASSCGISFIAVSVDTVTRFIVFEFKI